ncbi:MAG: ABC transporter ATP-binding protein [Lentisphaeria bacterium]|nr:ABC transporter ATP-binding protein [Lentisphaeria bacterium]
MSIECFNLSKHYGKKEALNDVSLVIPEGRITGLIGPNGAGKSTLIKLITGLVYPTSGTVRIDGFDSMGQHLEAMNRLGAVVEWPSFYPDLSARRNLAILSGGYGRKYEAKVEEVTSFLGIRNVLDRRTGTFSTGMKQRLGIALALLPDSKYIILDEPANGLDPSGIVEIRDLIRECNRRSGVTVLVSSHLLSEIELICDNVVMLVNGRLCAAGPLKELLGSSNRYRIIVPEPDRCFAFLQRAWEEKRLFLSAPPQQFREEIVLSLEREAAPEALSTELFRNGFALYHFARESESLEEFFISQSRTLRGEK